jgi:hypothetical protein
MNFAKPILASLLLLSIASQARAEYRTVLIQITQDKEEKTVVTIYSDDKRDQKSGVAVGEAVETIEKMTGWGSAVGVYVTSDGRTPPADLKKLLVAILDHGVLDLKTFGCEPPKSIRDYFLGQAGDE